MLNGFSKILCTLPKIALFLRHASYVKHEFYLLIKKKKSEQSGCHYLVWVFGRERSVNVEQLKKTNRCFQHVTLHTFICF